MNYSVVKKYKDWNLIIPFVTKVFASTIGADLVPVQPMSPPTAKFAYLK